MPSAGLGHSLVMPREGAFLGPLKGLSRLSPKEERPSSLRRPLSW